MHLTFIVNNTTNLIGGAKATAAFDEKGGWVGSASNADWLLSDVQETVEPRHFRIYSQDSGFCLEVLASGGIQVNGATTPVAQGDTFRLADGDLLQIGNFNIAAYISKASSQLDEDCASSSSTAHAARRFRSVASLIDAEEENLLQGNLLTATSLPSKSDPKKQLPLSITADPIRALDDDPTGRVSGTRDPVVAFDLDRNTEEGFMAAKVKHILDAEIETAIPTMVPDDFNPGAEHIALPGMNPNASVQRNPDTTIDSYLATLADGARSANTVTPDDLHLTLARDHWMGDIDVSTEQTALIDHVLLRPLCDALGLSVPQMSGPQADMLARTVGEALRTAIAGLMAVHQAEFSGKSCFAETHLHAIEDNPLRLSQSVNDSIRDLFLIRSPVHLSASAAIGESLEILQHHQKVSEVACEEALDRILAALSPAALEKRFEKYKGHAPRSGDLNAWHWQMYQHYFREMRSSQQGGLSRMFWEVYRQVYDKEMRQRTMEN